MSAIQPAARRRLPAGPGRLREERLWLLALGALAAVVLGYAAAALPPLLVLAGVGGVVLTLLVLDRPGVAALVVVLLVSNVPRTELYEEGPLAALGPIKVTDVLLAMALGAWLVGRFLRRDLDRLPARSITVSLAALLGLAFASLVSARGYGAELTLYLTELRPLLLLLLVFPVVASVRSLRELEVALVVFLGACAVEAAETILRAVRGEGESALFAAGATRVAAVYLYPLLLIVWGVVLLPFVRSTLQKLVLLGLTGLGIGAVFYTFERGSWIAAIAASMVIIVLLPRTRRWGLIATMVPLLITGAALVTAVNSRSASGVANPLEAGMQRLEAIFALQDDVSSRYRINEWTRAGEVILERPLTGIGLGSAIAFENPMWDEATGDFGGYFTTFYIHNSYIWVTLKLGVFGLLAYLALLTAALARGYRAYRRAQDPRRRRLLLGLLAGLCALAVMALTGQHGTDDPTTPYLAVAIACIELVPRLPARAARRAAGDAEPGLEPSGPTTVHPLRGVS